MMSPQACGYAAARPPEGAHALLGAECRGSKSACADLDGTKATRLWRVAARRRA